MLKEGQSFHPHLSINSENATDRIECPTLSKSFPVAIIT